MWFLFDTFCPFYLWKEYCLNIIQWKFESRFRTKYDSGKCIFPFISEDWTAIGTRSLKPCEGLTFRSEDSKFCPRRVTSCSYRPTHLYPSWICQSVVYLNWTRSCFNVVIFVFSGWLVNDHQSGSCECHLQNNILQVLSRNSHWAVSCLILKDTYPANTAVFPRFYSLRNVRSGGERGATAVFTGLKTPITIYLAFFRSTKTWSRGSQSPNWKFTACSS